MAQKYSTCFCTDIKASPLKILGQNSNVPYGKCLCFPLCGPSTAAEIQLVKAIRVVFLDRNKFSAKILH